MKVLLLLILVQLSMQQEWIESPLFESVLDFSIASNEQRTVIVFTHPSGLYYSLAPFDEPILIDLYHMNKTYLTLTVSNGTWITAFYNQGYIKAYRTTDEEFGKWILVYSSFSAEVQPAVASNGTDVWYCVYADEAGYMRSARSIDDGKSWPLQTASRFGNFSFSSLSSDLLIAFPNNGSEILRRISDGSIVLSVPGSGHPQVVSNNETVLFLSGSGDLYVSNDHGTNWTDPLQLVPGTLIVEDDIWLLITTNGTLFRSVDAINWITETIVRERVDKIDGTLSQFFFLRNGTIFRTAPFEIIPPNESFVVSAPLHLNQSLLVQGSISVSSSLRIEGDLALMVNATLNLTSSIEVSGTFTAGGRLIIPEGTGNVVLIQFNSSRGNFSQVVAPTCSQLKYYQSSLVVVFNADCTKPMIQLWMIIVIVLASVVAVAIAVVLFIFFRKKIAPYHDRKYHISSKNQQVA